MIPPASVSALGSRLKTRKEFLPAMEPPGLPDSVPVAIKVNIERDNLTVKEISQKLGYQSASAFSSAYKERRGVSPSEKKQAKAGRPGAQSC